MDLDNISRNTTDYIGNGPFGELFLNPVYVSFLVTIVILLIIISIYDREKIVKTGFYILCSSMFIIFIHNKLLLVEHKKQLCNRDMENICNNISSGPVSISGASESGLSYLSM